MKKTRILMLLLAVLSIMSLMLFVSCGDETTNDGDKECEHKWSEWKQDAGSATCLTDGTKSKKCSICKETVTEPDPDSATGHWFVEASYEYNGDATCKGDDYDNELGIGTGNGTETAKCALCGEAEDTRVAKKSALDHNWSTDPVEALSHNGWETFECLKCKRTQKFNRGNIDEDFEWCGNVGETPNDEFGTEKRYFAPNTVATLIARGEDGKALEISRSGEKLNGYTGYGIWLTPNYDLYRNDSYIFSYELYVTEETKDMVLLEGTKNGTVQVFARYDAETKSVIVNGKAVYELAMGEWSVIEFVLDDYNKTFDLCINKYMVAKKTVYDKNESYYHAAELESLAVRMEVKPECASKFAIDNIKTTVGDTVEGADESLLPEEDKKELAASTVMSSLNILGAIDEELLGRLMNSQNKPNETTFNKSYSIDTENNAVVWQNFKSGINNFALKDIPGLEKIVITAADAEKYPNLQPLEGDATAGVYDISDYESVTIRFHCAPFSDELNATLRELGRENTYNVKIQLGNPKAVKGNCYKSYQFSFVPSEEWQEVTIKFSDFKTQNNASLSVVSNFTISASGWANEGIGVGLSDNSNNNNNAADGATVKIQSVTFNKTETAVCVKPDADCEHVWGEENKRYVANCYEPGFEVKVCTLCEGEQLVAGTFVPSLEHNYETIKHVLPNCTEDGYHSYKCTLCGNRIRNNEGALGHDNASEVIAPTCYAEGYTKLTCKREGCGNIGYTEITAKTPHTPDTGVTETREGNENYVPNDCVNDAYWNTTCTVPECGAATTIIDVENLKTGHNDGGVEHDTQEWNCLQEGYDKFTCVNENCPNENKLVIVYHKDAIGKHTYAIGPDATSKDVKNICSECGDIVDVKLVTKLPTYAELLEQVKNTLYGDMVTDEKDGTEVTEGKNYGTAGAYVQLCIRGNKAIFKSNNGKDSVDKYFEWHMRTEVTDEHSYLNVFTKDTIPVAGNLVYEFAARLGEPDADGKYAPSDFQLIDRTPANVFATFASVTEDGAIKLVNAGEKAAQIALSKDKFTTVAFAFNFVKNVMDVYADGVLVANDVAIFDAETVKKLDMTTFSVDEIRAFQYQKGAAVGLCSWYDIANMALYGADAPVAITGIDYCAAAGVDHESDSEKAVVTAPVCGVEGNTVHFCKYCDATWTTTEAALVHVADETFKNIVTEPTCLAEGYTTKKCALCGVTYDEDFVAKLSHIWGVEVTVVTPATCFETGIQTKECTRGCGTTKPETIPVRQHVMVVDMESSTYDCENAGELIWVCEYEDCDHSTKEDREATGHNFQPAEGTSIWYERKPATCYQEGMRYRKCVNPKCTVEGGIDGDTLVDGEYLDDISQMRRPKTDHVLDEENAQVVPPTASSQGYTRTYCVNYDTCGHYVDSDFVDAESEFEFEEIDGDYVIVGYNGSLDLVIIPATFNGKDVIGIDCSIFGDWNEVEIGTLVIESDNLFLLDYEDIFTGAIIEKLILRADVTEIPEDVFTEATIGDIICECEEGDIDIWDVEYENATLEGEIIYKPDGVDEDIAA